MKKYIFMTIEHGEIVHNRVVIDPLNLTDETSQLLYRYLQRWRHNGLHLKRDTVLISGLYSSFTLTHDIYVTEIFRGKWRYDVIANQALGEGGSGKVYRTPAVIRDNRPALIVTPKQKRVYKNQLRDAWHEYAIMKRCHYLHVRPLLSGIPSLLSMRELPGRLLIDVLNDERTHQPFPLRENYLLTGKALRALEKIHDLQICHNDLTPRNMKYDPMTRQLFIFDFGISKLVNDKNDLRSRGNAVYAAPEEFISERTMLPVSELGCDERDNLQSHTTQKSDIFSMGMNLILIWRGDDPLFADKSDASLIIKKRAKAGWKVNPDLFHGMRGLSETEMQSIHNLLTEMTQVYPAKRPDINECITRFANIYLNYKLKHIPEEVQGMVLSAHYFATSLLHELDKVEKISDLKNQLTEMAHILKYNLNTPIKKFIDIMAKKFNKECNLLSAEIEKIFVGMGSDITDSIRSFLQKMGRQSGTDYLSEIFEKYARQIPDNIYAVAEFIERIDVLCLNEAKSKDELLIRFRDIIKRYHEQSGALSVCAQSDNKSLQIEASHLKLKIESTPITIDYLNEHTHHIEQKLIKLERDYPDDFRHLMLHPQLGI